jgi:hypothetical protein
MRIYSVEAGSSMYGTRVATSDTDIREVHLTSPENLLGFVEKSDLVLSPDATVDFQSWELRKFLKMAVSANPNILEVLFAPEDCVRFVSEEFAFFRVIKNLFLSKRIGETYLGYATSNYKRILSSHRNTASPARYDAKDAMHLIRLVRTGIEALEKESFNVRRTTDVSYFLSIRAGDVPWEHIEEEFLYAKNRINQLLESSHLPDQPNIATINEQCIDIYRDRSKM